ncbi:MAG: beta-ketoacyl-[acyl-carrier-protein] synthase family protein [Candidatus Eisenbacteria bacterium]|uniref:Nodulation protein E n=1 Tax=Eiseniibacteriota bacterium TaxID=2212470 RepID=A0A538TXJ5_UNCEI|nr:MAG: beta-ketoacyl-[acyl-carrier-protein] synthase family protein [Candidatus Eisenbacteria bacterium]
MQRRVVVTGLGCISALGANTREFWSALCECRPGIGPLHAVEPGRLRFSNGAEVRGFVPAAHFEPSRLDLLDRFAQFALVAARDAVTDSGLDWTRELRDRTAVICGSSIGGQTSHDDQFLELYHRNRDRVHPLTIPRVMSNAGASHIAIEFGLTGPTFTISSACSSSNHAIGQALWMVREGRADVALTGGSEAPFSYGILKAWEAMRVVAPDTCRPFSRDRKGLILGEGGAMLVLEPLDAARARGARIYAELAGSGLSADAHHATQPHVAGPARAMRAALADAGLAPETIGYINAHGTGTLTNDPVEARAIQEVFGAHAAAIPVSSTKSLHGHALGAAGALEAVATVLALHHGLLPPTANFTASDPECGLDVVPNHARAVRPEAALSNAFAFGGLNAVLAFRALSN